MSQQAYQTAKRRWFPLPVRISLGLVGAAIIPLFVMLIFTNMQTRPALIDQANKERAGVAKALDLFVDTQQWAMRRGWSGDVQTENAAIEAAQLLLASLLGEVAPLHSNPCPRNPNFMTLRDRHHFITARLERIQGLQARMGKVVGDQDTTTLLVIHHQAAQEGVRS